MTLPTTTPHLSPEAPVAGRRHARTFAALRRSRFYQPLAVLLAILLVPVFSWFPSGGDAARPFQAEAQTVASCNSTGTNSIIQKLCTPTGSPSPYAADIIQLESDAVNGFLTLHQLPLTDSNIIYTYGRSDLRDAIRAYILSSLITIIDTPAASRTQHQQNLYNWFQTIIQADEIAYYQNAYDEFLRWQADPCHFTLDPTIASVYNLKYDGAPFCAAEATGLTGPPVPDEGYFTTFGLLNSYGAAAANDPNFAAAVAGTSINLGEAIGIGAAVGVVLASVAGALIYASAVLSAAAWTIDGVTASGSILLVVSGFTVTALAPAVLAAGPLAIILVAAAIAINAGLQAVSSQQTIDELDALQSDLTNAQNTPPSLESFVADSSGQGMYKLVNALVTQTLPEMASSATLPIHQSTDPSFLIQPVSGASQVTPTLTYQDWLGNHWSARTYGGWFVQTCTNGSSSTCAQTDSIMAAIQYVDSSGTKWWASRFGNAFVSTKANPASTDVACQASLATGVTPPTNFATCSSYVSNSIQLLDENGNLETVSLQTLQTPAFPNTSAIVFAPGTPATASITASGSPTPTVCMTGGSLNSHISLPGGTCGTGSLELQFDGSSQAPTGSSTITVTATNLSGSLSQVYTVYIATALQFISPSTLNVTAGFPMTFLVQTTGSPTPTITDHMNLSGYGLSLKDNGNGTATISGTPTALQLQCVPLANQPCGIYASNGANTIVQNLTINTTPAPSAVLNNRTTTFLAGNPNSVTLVSTGAVTPVSWFYQADPNAPWLNFKDNGDGTATLSGTPYLDSSGSFTPTIYPVAVGSITIVGPGDQYTVNIIHQPVFGAASATFTAGTYNQASVFVSFGNIGLHTTLPSWLSWYFYPSGAQYYEAQGIFYGTPPAGSGGQYTIAMSDGSGDLGPATQNFNLIVNEAPQITSPSLAVMFAGQPGSFWVTTTGYPSTSTKAVSLTAPPTDPSAGNGMYFSATGLPASLTASNSNSAGFATGTLTISGTPANGDVGTHKINITAANAVGSAAQQSLALVVYPYSPTTAVDLIASEVLSRDASNNVVATVVVANSGNSAAANVAITSAKIGTLAGTVTPASIASIPGASTGVFTITFPGGSLGASGSPSTFILSGSYTGGTFSTAGRIVLP